MSILYSNISSCRLCGSNDLEEILSFDNFALTGIFPASDIHNIPRGPMTLMKCIGDDACGLVQLKESYQGDLMYSDNYGYRSGLNNAMSQHLKDSSEYLLGFFDSDQSLNVLDIGSNDGTFLGYYPKNHKRIGIDPTIKKFISFYDEGIITIPKFFNLKNYHEIMSDKLDIISTFSMFYDLEDPLKFAQDIEKILSDDGIWCSEQSYLPLMIESLSFDTICQEHIEYYTLKQFKWIADKVGLKIIDISSNDVNGGSFRITFAKKYSKHQVNYQKINHFLEYEEKNNFNEISTLLKFKKDIHNWKENFLNKVEHIGRENQIYGLGASTKGNTLLQFCNFTDKDISLIGEVNKDKFNCYTPGTNIKIIDENEIIKLKPNYLVILPWHFKNNFLKQKKLKGINLIFPLPNLEIIKID